MSNIPYYIPHARFGYKFGSAKFVDGLERDGLENVYDQKPMGDSADLTATKYGISRETQDAFAIESYKKAAASTEAGHFKNEIVPISIPQRRKDPILMTTDEEYKRVNFDKIPALRPVFNKDGSVTAANASTINDGGSALVLASEDALKKYNLTPIARIVSFADAASDPKYFTTAPTKAAPIALERAGKTKDEIDLYEVNEAFAVVTLAFNQVMDIPGEKVNVHGGAVAIGHPLGASGARIVTTLINALDVKGGTYGCAAICNGGGGASSMVVEKM
jgi:acetyl-CoA C-acetyltransferase